MRKIYILLITLLTLNANISHGMNLLPIKQSSVVLTRYTVKIQSSNYYINGCTFYFTADLAFDWDGNHSHPPTNIEITNPVLNYSCPPSSWQAKEVSVNITTNSGVITSFEIELTGNPTIDQVITNTSIESDLMEICNEETEKKIS